MKKTFKILTAMVLFVCFCFCMGAASSNTAYAELSDNTMKPYYGAYYLGGDVSCGSMFYFKDIDNSTFRGNYPGVGFVACAYLDSSSSTFSPRGIIGTSGGENLSLIYKKWARRSSNGDFVTESERIEILGCLEKGNMRIGSADNYVRTIKF